MGCGNSKVENSGRKDDENENDKNNNETNKNLQSKSQTSQSKSQTSQSKSQTSRTKQSNLKQTQNTGNDVNENDSEKKRVKVAVNEKGYKKRIRENLRNASAGHDIEQLEKAMEIFVNNKMEDGGDYAEAQDRMQFLMLRKEIKDACMRNHPVVLDKAILNVEGSPYKRQLAPFLERAYYLKQHQTELDTFRHDISNMEQSTISEIRSYNHPPDGVHETMIATYLICGYPEEHLTDWSEITALMGRYGKPSLIREVQSVDQKNIDKNTALRARHYLGQYTLEEVRSVSNGAAAFYVWSSRMVGKNDVDKKSNTAGSTHLTNSRRSSQQQPNKPITPADAGKNAKQQKQQQNVAKQQNTNTAKK